jgi:hypothetical protein
MHNITKNTFSFVHIQLVETMLSKSREVLKSEITDTVDKILKPVKLKSICIWDSSVIVHPIIYRYAPFISSIQSTPR